MSEKLISLDEKDIDLVSGGRTERASHFIFSKKRKAYSDVDGKYLGTFKNQKEAEDAIRRYDDEIRSKNV